MPELATLVLLADLIFAPLGPVRFDLEAVARASPRPSDCVGVGRGSFREFPWESARHPGLQRFCDRLAHGYAVLGVAPKGSLEDAAAAGRLVPGRIEPGLLAARALAKLRRFPEAFERFELVRANAPRLLEAPAALHDFAVSALRSGHPAVALESYRALVPRARLLEERERRVRVYVEAAVLAMATSKERLDEAVGYLSEARRQEHPPGSSDFVLGALALALDRQGRRQEAAGVVEDSNGPWALDRIADSEDAAGSHRETFELPRGEIHAMTAALAAGRDPELARQHWERYVELSADGLHAEHARRQLERLRGRGR